MISRRHRFHGYSSLNFAYRHGAVTRDPFLSVRIAPNPRRATYRVAVIVSRKVHKSAVRRNRIRRRLYEIVRMQDTAIAAPYDMVLTVFSDQLADMPAPQLIKLVVGLLRKSGAIRAGTAGALAERRAIVTVKEDS